MCHLSVRRCQLELSTGVPSVGPAVPAVSHVAAGGACCQCRNAGIAARCGPANENQTWRWRWEMFSAALRTETDLAFLTSGP